MKQFNAKQWFVSACVVSLLVPALSVAEYGGGGSSSPNISSAAEFDAKFKAADGALGDAGQDLKGLNEKDAKTVAALQKRIDELTKSVALDATQKEKIEELNSLLAKVDKINAGIATAKKKDLDKALADDKANRQLLKNIQAKISPAPVSTPTPQLDAMNEKCGKQEIQALNSGWKQNVATLPKVADDMKKVALDLIEGDKKDFKKRVGELKAKMIAELSKADEQASQGDDLAAKAEKASADKEDGTTFFKAVEKGIKVAKEWERKRSFQLVNTFFDALEKADEREDRDTAMANLASRFVENYNTFVADTENKFMAAASKAEGACIQQERKMRGTNGQQPNSTGLRGLQGQVVDAFEKSFDPTGQAMQMNPQNASILAAETNKLSTALQRRGSNAGICPTGVSAQAQTLIQGIKAEGAKLTGQKDPQLMIDQAIATVTFAGQQFAAAGALMDSTGSFCTAMANEVQFLEEQKSKYAKTGSERGQQFGAAGGFPGGLAGAPGQFGGFPQGGHGGFGR